MRALLFDATKCIGCGSCETACQEQNRLPEVEAKDLTDNKFTAVKLAKTPAGEVNYRRMCMHCEVPTCVSVCPPGALRKTSLGPVVYDANHCLGCRYCIQACPFDVPRYQWSSLNPALRKCNFCVTRLSAGKDNACAEACPAGATMAGEREGLLKEAHARLAAQPAKYVNKVYGEHDVGGTSVLVLSSVPFNYLELPANLPGEALPVLTFRVLSKIPAVVMTGGFALMGLYWITQRRRELALEEAVRTRKPAAAGHAGDPLTAGSGEESGSRGTSKRNEVKS